MNAFGSAMTHAHIAHWLADDDHWPAVLARHDGDEMPLGNVPSPQLSLCPRTAGEARVLLDKVTQYLAVSRISHGTQLHHRRVALLLQLAELVEHQRQPAAHSGGEVPSGAPEHDHRAASHVLAAVITDTFDNRYRSAVPDREALARNAGEIRFTRRRTVKNSVADQNRLIGDELRRPRMPDDQATAGKSLADVVIRFSFQLHRDSARQECREALARRSVELQRDRFVGQPRVAVPASDLAG